MRAASIPVFEEEPSSETGILIRDAIACVREVARLDDKVVLPPLPVLAPRTTRVAFPKDALPKAANDVAIATPPSVVVVDRPAPAPTAPRAALVDTQRTSRRARSRYPIVLCALVALASGVASFLASPYAHRDPTVQKATATVEQKVTAAASWVHQAVN